MGSLWSYTNIWYLENKLIFWRGQWKCKNQFSKSVVFTKKKMLRHFWRELHFLQFYSNAFYVKSKIKVIINKIRWKLSDCTQKSQRMLGEQPTRCRSGVSRICKKFFGWLWRADAYISAKMSSEGIYLSENFKIIWFL